MCSMISGWGFEIMDPLNNSLSSHVAHHRLLVELQEFYDRRRELKARRMLEELWPVLLNSFFLVIGIVCVTIVLSHSLTASETTALFDSVMLLIQLLVILITIVCNVLLEVHEIQIKSLWHIKRCMSYSDNFMGQSPCPWESNSYPSQAITTLRSQITVKGLRDRALVNIPCTLLVCGDIIQLDQNTPSPACVKVLGTGKELKVGEAPRILHPFQNSSSRLKFIEEDEFYWCKVKETPIMEILEKSVESSPPHTLLYQQKTMVYKIVNCLLIPILFFVLLFLGLARQIAFKDYFNWESAILLGPTYSAVLLLAPSFQIIWRIMNGFGIVLYNDMLKSNHAPAKGPFQAFIASFNTSVRILKAICAPYDYPLPEHVHSLGSLTAICAVDKEYLLTGGMPVPEKVFFFRSEMQNDQKTTPPESAATPSGTDDDISGIEFSCDLHSARSDSVDGKPLYSIEITPEIFGISKNADHMTGLSFDDPKWISHINSLKPIALNIFTTSHIPYLLPIHHHSVTSFALQHYLYKTQCSCPLAYEIGVSEYATQNFSHSQLLYLIGEQNQIDYPCVNTFPRNRSHSLMQKLWNDFVQPHFMSMLIEDHSTNQMLLMSRGSADLVVNCCQDFWDGQDLQPITEAEKFSILDFFARKTLSAYCIALAYSPLSQHEAMSLLSNKKTFGIYLPGPLQQNIQHALLDHNAHDMFCSSSSVMKVLNNQIFLGMVSLQYQPKDDIIALVQNLKQSGIRFIHYTAENEVRGKLFAEKLGLEAGWNCHISLSSNEDQKSNENSDAEEEFEDDVSTSSDSSGSSLYYTNESYIKAKLPKGIDKVRNHIEKVDNVPLLVPLFTDCNPTAVVEMIRIMQENGEVVLCMGNAWVRENISILAQANIGISFTPSPLDIGSGDCAVLSSTFARKSTLQDWPTPMEAASSLNSLTSGAYLARDADVSLISIVQQCRHSLGCIQRGLLCFLALSLCVTLVYVLSAFFFQPLPLSGGHLFWLVLVAIPLLSLSILSIGIDKEIISRLPDRKNLIWNKQWKFYSVYFCIIYVPISVICLTIYWLSLSGLCKSAEFFDCDAFLGNTNQTAQPAERGWEDENAELGWEDENKLGHLLAQNITAMFLILYLALSTLLFIHHSKPTFKVLRYITWQYVTFIVFIVTAQIIFFVISQSLSTLIFRTCKSFSVGDLPFFIWLIGFLWIFVQVALQEMVKLHNHKIFIETQTRLKLSFETKLGMHSPV